MFIVFTKGEIIMNNIYKVIWSKAKNCYVVASEIARSHTKSATGSEKIGGVTRRSILASLVALSLLCGGFGVATAADGSVHVEDIASTATSKEVYTAGKVDTLLADYGKKTDVETNKNDIVTLNTTTTNQGNQITANTTNIANNTAAIAKKADVTALGEYAKMVDVNTELAKKADAANVYTKTEADTKLADYAKTADVNTALAGKADKATTLAGYGINDAYTKGEVDNALNNKADKATTLAGYGIADAYTKGEVDNALNDKADKATTLAGYGITDAYTKAEVNTAVANAVTTAGNNVDTKLADYAKTTDVYNKAEVDGKITAEANARNNAITAAIAQERNDRDGAINTAINGEVTNRNQAIDNAIAQEVTDRNAAVTNAKAELQAKITAEETARTNADTAFNTRLTTAEGKIGANETAIGELKAKDTELEGKITTLEGSGVKYDTAVKDKITLAGAGGTTITNLKDAALNESSTDAVTGKQLNKTNENLAAEETARTTKDAELEGKITKNSQDITKLKEKDIELEGNIQTNANNIQANADAITATNKRTAGIKRNDATNETTIEGNVTVDNLGNVKAKGDVTAEGKLKGAGLEAGAVNAGSLKVENASQLKGDVTMDKTLSVTGDTKLKKTDVDGTLNVTGESSLKNTKVDGTLTTTGKATFKEAVEMDKGLTVTNGATTLKGTKVDGKLTVTGDADLKNTTVDGTLSVNKETTLNDKLTVKGEATFKDKVTMENDLEVKGELKTDKISMKNTDMDADGTIHNSSTTITADGITHNGEVKKGGVTTESQFTHTEKGSETYAKKGDTTDWTETRSDVTADGVKTEAKDSKGNRTNTSQTTEVINGYAIDKDGNSSTTSQTAKDINGNVTDKDGNKTDMKVTATENSIQIQDKDGKNTNLQVNTKDSSVTEITNAAGATTKTEQTAKDITNIAEQGTIKNDAMNIENNASGNIKNTAQNGTITNDAKDIVNNATGDMTNTVGGKLTTTVTGQATENFNGGLDTNVTGTENHTVTGKQTNTVKGGQENIISGGQTNTITGGQINNITGDQTTTITGNKKETVTENVTEDYQKDLTTTVGGNENHEVKGTKTETVEGKVTENYKAGQATNVTGDQDITVSGTQTTTATDINRNASSSMVDKVDNAYGTNTETKVAGKTTTDVSIKGTGEKGQYIRGANESRDYLIKGTLKNSETKTAEATSTEITDGINKASTRQDAKNLAGSVTNGTETGVSGIHAKDNSVSIDSIVTDGNKYSVINQKKGSIQSTVVDGTNSTVILQDKDNVTIASSKGMVAIGGKDIVNNAQDTITNTAGTKITDTAGDSTVTTEKAKGTTFTKTGSTAYSTEAGTPTDTNIAGNHITTGRVNANELGVSDKDGDNTADFSVEAGEGKGVKASAGDGTTTGSLDVKADEVVSSVKDADGKGSTFKQRIDAIMMESKNVSIKAEETLTNEAKDIVTNASNSITEKVGETNVTTKTTTSSKSEIQNADTITSVQQTEDMVQSYVGKKDGSATNVTTNFANASANMVTQDGQTSTVLNNKDGLLVRNTANGSSFITADGTNTGAALEWTNVKGNEISTGKVEANYVKMDYADVMKDLGVRGNANITGKTTTGSLEVTGTSTLKGDVTMGSNATVKKDLTVEGNTNLKNTKVDGTLDVTQKATFGDSVSIAKDLSVDGNATIKGDVTAKSYKVGDKTYISAAGINANDQKITNVADGSISEGSKDAVNGGQLYTVKNDLEGKVNKVGANAAAMANLHPMEFDPDSKWNIAAAIGNYGSETAAALGAFYRPNDDVMVNLSTAFGTGENMVGGGVSVRLGKSGNKLSREESNALKDQVNDLTARMDALLSVLNPNMSKDFPDVPENHWAYEAVSRLAGNDIVQGYPDGEFHGERTMTRYEMAEIIYNALSRGAEAEKELVEEFKPELQAMAASEKATAERAEG